MNCWKSRILAAGLALVASPLLIAAQGAPAKETAAPPPGAGQGMHRGMPGRGMMGPRGRMHGRQLRDHLRGRRNTAGMLLHNPAVRERLGITQDQTAKIETLQNDFLRARIQRHANIQTRRLELRQLMAAENPDRASVEKKMRDLNEARLAAQLAAMDHLFALREVLTPKQREQLQQMRWERPGPGDRRGPQQPAPPSSE